MRQRTVSLWMNTEVAPDALYKHAFWMQSANV
jgi:hypothetical protein